MYLVVFFLLLWTLFQCILCEKCLVENPDPKTLYVLSSQNYTYHRWQYDLNYNIYLYNTDIKNIDVIRTDCPSKLQDALKLTKNLSYVIYYGITDFYKNNYNDVRNSKMELAGDYGHLKEQEVCKSDKGISMDISLIREIKGQAITNCSSFNQTNEREYTILTSKNINIDEIPGIDDLIHKELTEKKYDERSKINEFIILFCSDFGPDKITILKDTFKHILVKFFHIRKCKQRISDSAIRYNYKVIAIIVPGPEYIDLDTLEYYADIPIIFYDEITKRAMVDMYENAIIRKTKLKDEVTKLRNLLTSYRWKRVAILSDGSAPSRAFENEVRTVFDRSEVSYTVKSVEGQSKCCNFNEILSSLQSVDARIIIANVDQQYADSLVKAAQRKGMTKAHIMWIARAWSAATCIRAANYSETILTVTVDPNPLEAVRAIQSLFDQDHEYTGFLNKAKFAEDIRKEYELYQGHFVAKPVRGSRTMPSDMGQCTLRSDNFDKPCDDIAGIMIALVVVMLSVTILGITYFFDEPNTPYNRMAH